MILEEMFNGKFYPCETVVADSPRFKQANTAFRRGYLSKRKPMSKWRREKKSSIPIVAVLILSTATLLP